MDDLGAATAVGEVKDYLPWAVSLVAPFAYGALIVEPHVRRASDNQIRLMNAGGAAVGGTAAFLSWQLFLNDEIVVPFPIRALTFASGAFCTVGAFLALASAVMPGPFIRSKSDLQKIFRTTVARKL